MARRLRIAFARIAQETNALSPIRTTVDDFRQTHWLEGAELLKACHPLRTEAKGFMRNAELSGFVAAARTLGDVEPVPLFSSWAVPSGPLSRAAFEEFRDRLDTEIRAAGPLDGVFLSLHGAMGVEGVRDPETEFLRVARTASRGALVGASYDLHANFTRERVEAATISCAYRTNPHIDHARTGRRAGELLIRAIRGEIRPQTAWRSLPMILGGGKTIDFLPPVVPIFRRMTQMERSGEALSASFCMCHPWNDDPHLGWSVLVHTDGDRDRAERLADELAEAAWEMRAHEPPPFATAEEAIEEARSARLARKLGCVTIADASDVVTAGATGGNTHLVKALVEQGEGLLSYVPLRDPNAVEALWSKPDGTDVTLSVGGTIDPERHEPIEVSGRIRTRRPDGPFGRMVVLDLGHVQLVLTDGLPAAMKPAFYGDLGLDPWKADVVVVKNFFPFRVFFLPYSRRTIYVRTRGLTDLDAAFVLPFANPVHPRDRVEDWRATDRVRRGVD